MLLTVKGNHTSPVNEATQLLPRSFVIRVTPPPPEDTRQNSGILLPVAVHIIRKACCTYSRSRLFRFSLQIEIQLRLVCIVIVPLACQR